jgi:predicted nucleic acid-binding protein
MLKQIVAATGDQRAVLSSVGLTELVHGIYRAQTAQARSRRDSFIRELPNDLEVYAYTKETALLAGKIDGEQQSRGIIIPFGDLLIGATALEVGYSMLTVIKMLLNPHGDSLNRGSELHPHIDISSRSVDFA